MLGVWLVPPPPTWFNNLSCWSVVRLVLSYVLIHWFLVVLVIGFLVIWFLVVLVTCGFG